MAQLGDLVRAKALLQSAAREPLLEWSWSQPRNHRNIDRVALGDRPNVSPATPTAPSRETRAVVPRAGHPTTLSSQTVADRTARILMVGECTKAFPKVLKFWLAALEATETVEDNGRKVFKYSVDDQFEAAKCIMEYGFGKPVQPLAGAFQEQTHRTLEVRWMPPRADDRSKAVDLKPGE